jgi:sugar/nucleoside kinase (ribokinase family)
MRPWSARSVVTGPEGPVVVVGDVMTDVVAAVGEPLTGRSDVPAHLTTRQGGAGANVAHWLTALGVPTAFVGCVGDDPFGVEATAVLQVAGVDVHVTTDPHLPTGSCVVLSGADGGLSRLPDAGANSALSTRAIPVPLVRSARWLHLSGYTVLNPGSREAALVALRAAHEAGVPTSVDAASAAPLQAVGHKEFLRLTEGVDLAFCTLDEAEVLCDSREPAVVAARLTAAYPQVVVRLGAQGALWSSTSDVAGCRVGAARTHAPLVDTAGAGDAFVAAYLARLNGAGARRPGPSPAYASADVVRKALTGACALAAEVATRAGSRPG